LFDWLHPDESYRRMQTCQDAPADSRSLHCSAQRPNQHLQSCKHSNTCHLRAVSFSVLNNMRLRMYTPAEYLAHAIQFVCRQKGKGKKRYAYLQSLLARSYSTWCLLPSCRSVRFYAGADTPFPLPPAKEIKYRIHNPHWPVFPGHLQKKSNIRHMIALDETPLVTCKENRIHNTQSPLTRLDTVSLCLAAAWHILCSNSDKIQPGCW